MMGRRIVSLLMVFAFSASAETICNCAVCPERANYTMGASRGVGGVVPKSGVSKSRYLDIMEAAVSAYSDAHIAAYLSAVECDGVQEHGFPRLTANIGVLVANGRIMGRRAILKRMMDVACRDAKRLMPMKSGGNDFSVKELSIALAELERAKAYPKDVTDGWRFAICAVEAESAYTLVVLQ